MCVSVRKDSREKSAKQVRDVAWQPSVSTAWCCIVSDIRHHQLVLANQTLSQYSHQSCYSVISITVGCHVLSLPFQKSNFPRGSGWGYLTTNK